MICGESDTDRRPDVPALRDVRRVPETVHELVKEVRDVYFAELAVERGRRGEAVSRERGYDDVIPKIHSQQPLRTVSLELNLRIDSRKALRGVA